ncbi:hypothetical protein [Streptomyces sp. NPDC005408]|uniref:hypothetical protein n=1 Tax=Streptomyces sp. NPDC005408 TaxID=3155341 RepID=UPI0033A238DE
MSRNRLAHAAAIVSIALGAALVAPTTAVAASPLSSISVAAATDEPVTSVAAAEDDWAWQR